MRINQIQIRSHKPRSAQQVSISLKILKILDLQDVAMLVQFGGLEVTLFVLSAVKNPWGFNGYK